jgi:hypothetical protein
MLPPRDFRFEAFQDGEDCGRHLGGVVSLPEPIQLGTQLRNIGRR